MSDQKRKGCSGGSPCCDYTPSRFRLFFCCIFLAFVALIDRKYVAAIIALGVTEKRKIERKNKAKAKARVIFGLDDNTQASQPQSGLGEPMVEEGEE